MAFYELTKSVRITKPLPTDNRYIVGLASERSAFFTENVAYDGLLVYVSGDTAVNKGLYILDDTTTQTWIKFDTSATSIDSSQTQIIFNSGGTLTGSSDLTYDYDESIFKVIGNKSEVEFSTNTSYNPSISLLSDESDGIKLNIATSNDLGSYLETVKSNGTQETPTNITTTNLFTSNHSGYFNINNSAATIEINAVEWSATSYTTEYKISTVSSGNTNVSERLKITKDGALRFNDSYTFPTESGNTDYVLTQSGTDELYWSIKDTVLYSQNISSGGTFEFDLGNSAETNAIFLHFMNHRTSGSSELYQMGELQLLHDNVNAQVTTNGQDIDLFVTYTAKLENGNIVLICDVPVEVGLSTNVIMEYRIEKFG